MIFSNTDVSLPERNVSEEEIPCVCSSWEFWFFNQSTHVNQMFLFIGQFWGCFFCWCVCVLFSSDLFKYQCFIVSWPGQEKSKEEIILLTLTKWCRKFANFYFIFIAIQEWSFQILMFYCFMARGENVWRGNSMSMQFLRDLVC